MWIKTYDGQLLNSDLIEKIIVKQYHVNRHENANSGDHYVLAVFKLDRVSGVIDNNITEKRAREILDEILTAISQGSTIWAYHASAEQSNG